MNKMYEREINNQSINQNKAAEKQCQGGANSFHSSTLGVSECNEAVS